MGRWRGKEEKTRVECTRVLPTFPSLSPSLSPVCVGAGGQEHDPEASHRGEQPVGGGGGEARGEQHVVLCGQ